MRENLKFFNREFEQAVREELNVAEEPITKSKALEIMHLDLSNFTFDGRDYEALSSCMNLCSLAINTRADELGFLKYLPLLEELNLETWGGRNEVDFNCFSHLRQLRMLTVSGGDVSSIDYRALDGLRGLTLLETLTLHEFGSVDLSPLRDIPWIESFFCGYADKVLDIGALSAISNLKKLTIIDVEMESLDFLDVFPDSLEIELCALKVKNGIDYNKLSRFVSGDFEEIECPY